MAVLELPSIETVAKAARRKVESWRQDYNQQRPRTLVEMRAGVEGLSREEAKQGLKHRPCSAPHLR